MKKELSFLKKFNLVMFFLHLAQAIAVLFLSDPNKGLFPIRISYLKFNEVERSLEFATRELFKLNLAYLVVGFFLLSALAHLAISTFYNKKYNSDLNLGINKVRWYEYSLSASIMMVGIGLLSGIYDLASLVMIFILDMVMNLLGLVMEIVNQKRKEISWSAYIVGCIAGIAPWLVFLIYVLGAENYGGGNIPTFVYFIYLSIFLFFNSFALNMYLQYKKIGKWSNYLYGEKTYIVLSLVAKTLLAWQVFAGSLRP